MGSINRLHRWTGRAVAVGMVATVCLTVKGAAAGAAPPDEPPAVANELVVTYRPGAIPEQRATARGRAGAQLVEQVVRGDVARREVELVRTPPGSDRGVSERRLEEAPAVAAAEPNWIYTHAAASTDPYYAKGSLSQALLDAITRAARANILFIAAAGNGGSDQVGDNNDTVASYPSGYDTTAGAGYDAVLAVAAIDNLGARGGFSNYGARSVDIGAPGVGVWSTTAYNLYESYSGTSMATPHVTGGAALYASTHPGATAAEVKTAILSAAVATPSLAGKTVTGGRLNVSGF